MKNTKKNLTEKVANMFMEIGDLHISTYSFGSIFHEPKISIELLKNSQSKKSK